MSPVCGIFVYVSVKLCSSLAISYDHVRKRIFKTRGGKEQDQLINDKGIFRTAPTTLGLLVINCSYK